MAADNVEKIREAYRGFAERGFEGVADLIHPEFESRGGLMEALGSNRYRGPEGARRWVDETEEAWSRLDFEPIELVVIDDQRVGAYVRLSARGRESGAEIAGESFHVFTFKQGKVARLDVFENADAAFAAIGSRPADRA